ncbi:MAG TPA: SUMF1/EgtB/PvdO family nonheme iron enzyme [Anaerolineae bacterium]|nr:SUMF1/EgtB/PvdO family nonheme iron enzyme [Anaerolineae bacterium]
MPGCVFLIGADRDVIEEGIRVKYKSFLSGLGGEVTPEELEKRIPITGDDYLEKIVQLPFHIPPLREELVEKFIKEHEAGLAEGCAGIFCLGLEPNPRKVKRTLNIFRLLGLLAEERAAEGEMEEVEPQLLAKMVVILIRWRGLFKDLQEYPNLLPELEAMWRKEEKAGPDAQRRGAKGSEEDLADGAGDTMAGRPGREEEPLLERYGRIKALGKMLVQGPPWFADLSPEQLKEYIYLARSTSEAVEEAGVDIDERRWADLLSNDLTKIRAALADLDEAEKESCTAHLLTVIRSDQQPAKRVSAGSALALLGDPRPAVDPAVTGLEQMEFCYVPPGVFQMGSGDEDDFAEQNEKPLRSVEIPYGYWIARFAVTVAQLRAFAEAGHELGDEDSLKGLPNQPAVWVRWDEALAFCRWLGERFRERLPEGYVVALPSEAEWEKAARGGEQVPARPRISSFASGVGLPGEVALSENLHAQRRYPWGDRADSTRANYDATGVGGTSAVGCFAPGASPYGVEDLSGNVWEWTRSLWRDYPYVPDDGREDLRAEGPRVLRGGAFHADPRGVRCAFRYWNTPVNRNYDVGFRVVVFPGSPE